MFEELNGSGLLIHHWDTDGICSARLLLEHLSDKEIVNKTPELGNYYLTEPELSTYSSSDFIIIVDIALPEENIALLSKTSKVLIFDHHLQKQISGVFHHNPLNSGGTPDQYPSASWIVNEYLHNRVNVFTLLGIIGDHEQRIYKNQFFSQRITEFCTQEQYSFDELLMMVYLLDSNYKVGDRTAVEESPRLLLKYLDARQILRNKQWRKNLDLLDREITDWVESPIEEQQGILLKYIHSPYNIISTVTRHIAWKTGKDVVVINTDFFKDRDQVYVRSKKNLQPLIEKGKSLGFRCGGKAEVLGAVVLKEKTESFIQEIMKFLS
jgi:single-stranded DNA-specific DHH superfamily exonuclease